MGEQILEILNKDWVVRILILLFGIIITRFLAKRNINKIKKANTELLDSIKETIGEDLTLVDSDNIKIWRDFIGPDFKSYNDPWTMELSSVNKYIELHKERYSNSADNQFKFLFFNKNDSKAFERFVKFQASVHLGLTKEQINGINFNETLKKRIEEIIDKDGELPNTLNKIQVYVNNTIERPFITFFRGYNIKGKVALLYFSIKQNQEIPHMIINITDKSTWTELDDTWDNGTKEAIKINGADIFSFLLENKKIQNND